MHWTSTRTTDRTKTLIDHILTNSAEKVIQSGVIEMGLPDQWAHLFYKKNVAFETKWTLRNIYKVNESYFVEQLKAIQFSDYSNYTCVNDAYQDFLTKFLSVIDFVAPIRTLRVKFNTKPCFDIDVYWYREDRTCLFSVYNTSFCKLCNLVNYNTET